MTLQARPTTYRGIEMRSRLEAKFAAHLDEDGTVWEYEPRAYANQRGQYLPDFVIRDPGEAPWFIEVKPTIEAALAILERVEIVLDSEPDAFLLVVVWGIGSYSNRPGRRRWVWITNPVAS